MIPLCVATEDRLSRAVVDRLIQDLSPRPTVTPLASKDKGYLKKKLPELRQTARSIPVILLVDLDRLACPLALIEQWFGFRDRPENLLFRVVVRTIESWLLADREAFAGFVHAPLSKLPQQPESLDDPKQMLLNLVRRYGNRTLRAEILPARGSLASVGIGYNARLGQFVQQSWSPSRAARYADSLARARRRLLEMNNRLISVHRS